MPRNISVELAEHIRGQVLTLATIITVTRLDGAVLGFTNLDRNIVYNDVTYEKASAMQMTAMRNSTGAGVDNMEGMGLLNSNRVTDSDLLAGRYDGAEVEVAIINYRDPTQGALILLTGTLGQVTFQDGQFTVEFRSLSQRLSQQVVELTSLTCRAAFGDARCASGGTIGGQPLSFYQRTGKLVDQVTSGKVFRVDAVTDATAFFDYGVILFTTGLNDGISREIKTHVLSSGKAILTVQETFPFQIAIGDECTLTAGCDLRFAETCVAKFDNGVNFRGEPHIPGTEQVLTRGRR